MKECDMGGACSTYEKNEKTHTKFWSEHLKEKYYLRNL